MIPAEDIKWDESVLEKIGKDEMFELTKTIMREYHSTWQRVELKPKELYFFSNIVGNITLLDGSKSGAHIECVWNPNDVFIVATKVEFFDENNIPDEILDRINQIQDAFKYVDNKFIEWNKP